MTTQTETSQPNTAQQRWDLLWALAILTVIIFFLVVLCPVAPNSGFTGTAAVLSMITAVAVGIERIIECFWTIIGMTKGAFWPLSLINEQVNGMVNNLDDKLRPVYEDAEKAMNKLVEDGKWTTEKLAEAKKELDELKVRTAQLKALAPDNQRVNMIAASAFQSISFLEKKYPEVVKNAEVAHQAIVGVSDFVATFKDNPGRRLISILLGMILGLLVAGVVRLDVFLAASSSAPGAVSQTTLFGTTVGLYWAVAFTGLLMGLGSNPTHEVIRAIQEYKKTRKSDNDPAPVTVQTEGGGGAAYFAAARSTTRVAARGVNTFSLRRRL